MLNIDMKRKINTLRDILVGRIPDPKTQVEQITLAMIFKFMDDIDTEFTGEWGGDRTFFVKTNKMDYSKYAWSNIMSPQVSGEERSNLYREGIENMAMNPHIPQLFRDIFRNAYLPFRDPETINMFLKEIDDLKYDNSEDLGNAFEMLLSIMGSQGDAGQFRTPRHIIDMIVEIVDPAKTDSILDPACGTAGFLISAYKHILNRNKDKNGNSTLAPDERNVLTTNITGYDISPDMVRLSNVNLYLHHFPEPHIHIYDTLTSEARWDDTYDVILANPPFMTPKGGINPHNRFRVNARRSEVLFVDYIAEHLNPNGKAGIIVPEGIIFQTSNAYKELRKMLIEDNYLYAVISLPAGVFNPYSGVKTSILLFDRTIAKQTDNILFVKIDNDGFDLGAQRRKLKLSEIPRTIEVIQKYKKAIISGETIQSEEFQNDYSTLASKKEIVDKDCVLVGERYRKTSHIHNHNWDMVELVEVLKYEQPTNYLVESVEYKDEYPIPVLTAGKSFILGYTNEIEGIYSSGLPVIIFDDFTTATQLVDFKFKVKSTAMKILSANEGKADIKYLYYTMQNISFDSSTHKRYWISQYSKIKIPLPPLSFQQEIVEEIESYKKIIDGARQVVENYKPMIKIDPEWEMVELGEVCEFNPKKSEIRDLSGDTEVSFVPMVVVNENEMFFMPTETRKLKEVYSGYTYFAEGDVLLAKVTPCFENGKSGIARNLNNNIGFGSSEFYIYRASNKVLPEWIYIFISSNNFKKEGEKHLTGTGGLRRVDKSFASSYKIPIPTIDKQKEAIDKIYEEQKIIESNKQLIGIFEQKIKDKISEVWGE